MQNVLKRYEGVEKQTRKLESTDAVSNEQIEQLQKQIKETKENIADLNF